MIIKTNHVFTFRNTTKNTINQKNEKILTNGTGKITCEVPFKVVDDSRKVDIYTTVKLICEIKHWIKVLSETTPKRNKKGFLNNELARLPINKWEHWLGYLIPENRALSEIDFTADFKKQHFVKLNYKLLEDNNLLSYNQALFLLLGLNAIELDDNITDFPVLNGTRPSKPIESYFWYTDQNQALKHSAFVVDGKITSENLVILATKENNFFTKYNNYLASRTIDEATMKKLNKLLKDNNFITGEFNELWQWKADRGQLAYLARCLEIKKILPKNCHKELANYIQDSSKAKKQLKDVEDPKSQQNINPIDSIIKQLTQ